MFDIGFFELMLIAVVGLLVIGPERLPETLRTLGLWIGRIKRGLRETRAEIEQHIGADEIRRQLHNEEIMHSLKQSRDELNRTLSPDLLKEDRTEDRSPSTEGGSPRSEPSADRDTAPEKPADKS